MLELPGYKPLKQIHTGKRSRIFKASRLSDGLPVILKTSALEYPPESEIMRFRREYSIGRTFNHPNIIRYFSLESSDSHLAIVQEDFDSLSLSIFLRELKQRNTHRDILNILTVLKLGIDMATGLNEIHKRGIIHKDIKPGNLVINPADNRIKFIDFGISSRHSRNIRGTPPVNPKLEGTLAYISPEQTGRTNRGIDYRADLYSLGVTLYEILTGVLPFQGSDPLELTHDHIARLPAPPHRIREEVPEMLSRIILKLLEKNAEDRYQTARGLRFDLQECLREIKEKGAISIFATGARDISSRLLLTGKLYGRDKEIQELEFIFQKSAAGKRASALITGDEGVGKSSLGGELKAITGENNGFFVEGKFERLSFAAPYSVFGKAFRSLLNSFLGESEKTLFAWRRKIQKACGSSVEILYEFMPELKTLMGVDENETFDVNTGDTGVYFNLAFRRFLEVLATRERPLVVFFDDIHRADPGSLSLLKSLMEDHIKYLFPVFSCRNKIHDPENPDDNPQEYFLSIPDCHQITLNPLSQKNVEQLLSEVLQSPHRLVRRPARLLFEKTAGAPMFLLELLTSLHQDGALKFDIEAGVWNWDLEAIQDKFISENVVQNMLGGMREMPANTKKLLAVGACLNEEFLLKELSKITETEEHDCLGFLLPALEAGFIIRSNDETDLGSSPTETNTLEKIQYRFSHNRVRQAAYSLLEEQDRAHYHLTIARMQTRSGLESGEPGALFELADHYNLGHKKIQDNAELLQLAGLNLQAARRAKQTGAYTSSERYLEKALEVFPAYNDESGALLFAIKQELVEVYLLNDRLPAAQKMVYKLREEESDLYRKNQATVIIIKLLAQNADYNGALDEAFQALAPLNISLPREVSPELIQAKMELIGAELNRRGLENILGARPVDDPQIMSVIDILGGMRNPAFFANQSLWVYLNLYICELSINRGLIPQVTTGFCVYGILLCKNTSDIHTGYTIARDAIRVADRLNFQIEKAISVALFLNNINPWNKHFKEAESLAEDGVEASLAVGAVFYAGYIFSYRVMSDFFKGRNISDQLDDISLPLNFGQKTGNKVAIDCINATRLVLARYFEHIESDPNLIIDGKDELLFLKEWQENKSALVLSFYWIMKAELHFRFESYMEAYLSLEQAVPLLADMGGNFWLSSFHFYRVLTLIQLKKNKDRIKNIPGLTLEILEKDIEESRALLEAWAQFCPENFLHKKLLIEAEIAQEQKDFWRANEIYDRAISTARKNGYSNDEALCSRLAVDFWINQDKHQFASIYIRRCRNALRNWGANSLLRELEKKFPGSRNDTADNYTTSYGATTTSESHYNTGTGSPRESLDLVSISRILNTISGEIELDSLLTRIMNLILENAGAVQGVLLLKRGLKASGELLVEARANNENREVELSLGHSLDESELVPLNLVRFVARTGATQIMADAGSEGDFINDPYIQKHRPRSILCTPIRHKDSLVGVLYLENNLSVDAFTRDRVHILDILLSQAAISLENSFLYEESRKSQMELRNYRDRLEDLVRERTQELHNTNERLIEQREQIQKSEERWRVLWQNVPDIIAELDPEGRILLINREIPGIVLPGKEDSILEQMSPEGRKLLENAINETLKGKEGVEYEIALPPTPGLEITWQSHRLALIQENHKNPTILLIASDISRQKDAELILKRVNEELEGRVKERTLELQTVNQELEAFAYSVAHDLRTPLRGIGGFSHALLDDYGVVFNQKGQRYLERIKDAALHMGNLMDDLLIMSSVIRKELSFGPVRLDRIAREIIDKLQKNSPERKAEIIIEENLEVRGDASLLHIFLENLLGNAWKFSASRQETRIEFGRFRESGRNEFVIQDNGIGFDMAYSSKLFRAFEKLHAPGMYDGTGIGLAVAEKIIRRHRGEIHAKSETDRGASIFFSLPK